MERAGVEAPENYILLILKFLINREARHISAASRFANHLSTSIQRLPAPLAVTASATSTPKMRPKVLATL